MGFSSQHKIFTENVALKAASMFCMVYVAFMTFAGCNTCSTLTNWLVIDNLAENTDNGVYVSPRNGSVRAIIATDWIQMVSLVIARATAFYMYPSLVLVYFTKMRATMNLLEQTPISLFLFQDAHELHVYCGQVIFWMSILHTIFHLLRWALQGNMYLLFDHYSGISGFVLTLALFLIVLPMWKYKQINYEIRKAIHYVYLVFAIALVFHAPTAAFPNGGFCAYIFSILLIWIFLDYAYCTVFLSEKIETTVFHVLPSGVQMTMAVSERYHKTTGGYCYIMLPWVDKTQWHAFSLFEHPTNPHLKQVFMLKNGDWTKDVHDQLQRDTVRPVWVQGPFQSPYNRAIDYDNQILVAAGIGITPALSVIRAQKEHRRTNLIWAVRDPHMLIFFLEHAYLDHGGWNLFFYTGKEPLVSQRIDELTSTNVQVIRGRPDLSTVIRNIIYGIESKTGLPDCYAVDQKVEIINLLRDKAQELRELQQSQTEGDHGYLTLDDRFAILSNLASDYGYEISHIVTEVLQNTAGNTSGIFSSSGGGVATGDGASSFLNESDTVGESEAATDNFVNRLIEYCDELNQSIHSSKRSAGASLRYALNYGGNEEQPSNPPLNASATSAAGNLRRRRLASHAQWRTASVGPSRVPSNYRGGSASSFLYDESVRSAGGSVPSLMSAYYAPRVAPQRAISAASATSFAHSSVDPETGGGGGSGSGSTTRTPSVGLPSRVIETPEDDTSGPLTVPVRTTDDDDNNQSSEHVPLKSDVDGPSRGLQFSNSKSMVLMQEALSISFKPWEHVEEAEAYVKNLDKQRVLSSWGILFCGGKGPVSKALKQISKEYDIDLHSEAFSW